MTQCYEFLASQEEWEQNCLSNSEKYLGNLPEAFRVPGIRRWTFPAQLFNTLTVYSSLDSLARNGDDKKSIGYPAYVRDLPVGTRQDTQGNTTDEGLWHDFSAPSPAVLDRLPSGCLLLKFDVTLKSPFFSRDDQYFYPTENVLRRHKIFEVPYLSASGIKGLLRWAHRMRSGVLEDGFSAALFGEIRARSNDSDPDNAGEVGQQGMLYTYPLLWQGTVGLEVINPSVPDKGAGTKPIKYEVVKPGKSSVGTLLFFLSNLPGRVELTPHLVGSFLDDLSYLELYGALSAKSSAGWGRFKITGSNAALKGAAAPAAPAAAQSYEDKELAEAWAAFTAPDGTLRPLDPAVFTNNRFRAVLGESVSMSQIKKNKQECYDKVAALFAARNPAGSGSGSAAGSASTATDWLWAKPQSDFASFRSQLLEALKASRQTGSQESHS